MDTLIFADYSLAHVVSPFQNLDPSQVAHRDMGIFFTRRLSYESALNEPDPNPSFYFDDEVAHEQLPCAFSIHTQHL